MQLLTGKERLANKMNSLMVRMAELVTLIIYNEAHGIIIYLDGDIPLEASHIACASSSLAPHHKLWDKHGAGYQSYRDTQTNDRHYGTPNDTG